MAGSETRPVVRASDLIDALGGSGSARRIRDVVEWSAADPASFHAELFKHHASRSPKAPKSAAPERYDVYHDLVLRHVGEERAAVRWLDVERQWQALTFEALHGIATARAQAWAGRGVEAGQTVALLFGPGPELVVALAAAARLGLVVSILPPQGDRFVARRLDALAPDHVAVDAIHASIVPAALAEKVLPDAPTDAQAMVELGSHTYEASEPLARLFSPLAEATDAPIALAVGDAYLRAIRDAYAAYGLRPGDALAAPGMHPLQHQPALILAALLVGATYVHLSLEEIEEDPQRLAAHPLRSLGFSREARELLLRGTPPALGKTVAHWWRSPLEAGDLRGWEHLAKECGLEKTPASNILVDAARGGALLVSARRPGGMHVSVAPGAGVPFSVTELNESGKVAAGDVGFLTLGAGKAAVVTPWILARQRDEWFCPGAMRARRHGRTYPADEILACLAAAGFGFYADAAIVPAPASSAERPYVFVLILFTGPGTQEALDEHFDTWEQAVRLEIGRRLGEEFQPDRVEAFPLDARKKEKGGVDVNWVQAQYVRGSLSRKSRAEAFQLTGELRRLAAAAAAKG